MKTKTYKAMGAVELLMKNTKKTEIKKITQILETPKRCNTQRILNIISISNPEEYTQPCYENLQKEINTKLKQNEILLLGDIKA